MFRQKTLCFHLYSHPFRVVFGSTFPYLCRMELKTIIEEAWENRSLLSSDETQSAIREVIESLDKGLLRVAEPNAEGKWTVNEWVKKAVVMYFPIQKMETLNAGPFEFHDKMALKTNYKELGVRVVPHAVARYGAFIASGVIMMPSYINIGAYVDSGTMVDTWATVGSCAQIGKDVHLSGGVGIGGVLEPLQAAPVIVDPTRPLVSTVSATPLRNDGQLSFESKSIAFYGSAKQFSTSMQQFADYVATFSSGVEDWNGIEVVYTDTDDWGLINE